MKKVLTFVIAFLSMSSFAETLHLGRFASLSSNEDESLVKVESVRTIIFASTSGASLTLKGCNAGKVTTGEGAYGTSYKSIDVSKVLESQIIAETGLGIEQAQDSLDSLRASLKKKVPFYCSVESVMAVELTVRVLSTNRLVKAILNLRSTTEGLMVETIHGNQDINSDITVYEVLP